MIVVSDTSPIINLAAIGRLDLLQQLFSKISIPNAVFHEITVAGAGQPGALEVRSASWISSRQVSNLSLVTALRSELDPGEAEAIALAIEIGSELLLMDERLGRGVATRFGLKVMGILGLLIEGKGRGFIHKVEPIPDDLTTKAGFWMSRQLRNHILSTAGEHPA